jgi:hypothetical protein
MDGAAMETPEKDASGGNTTNDVASSPTATLLAGLAPNEYEKNRLATVFWEKAWPKLEENGWSKVRFIVILCAGYCTSLLLTDWRCSCAAFFS